MGARFGRPYGGRARSRRKEDEFENRMLSAAKRRQTASDTAPPLAQPDPNQVPRKPRQVEAVP